MGSAVQIAKYAGPVASAELNALIESSLMPWRSDKLRNSDVKASRSSLVEAAVLASWVA